MANELSIIAVEPIPSIFKALQLNLSSLDNITLLPVALGDKDTHECEFSFYPRFPGESTRHPKEREAQRSILKEARLSDVSTFKYDGNATPLCGEYRHPSHDVTCDLASVNADLEKQDDQDDDDDQEELKILVSAQMKTLSSIFQALELHGRVGLLKIDCEGDELIVLQGMQEHDWARVDQVIVEVHDIDDRLKHVVSLLSAHQFTHIECKEQKSEKTDLYEVCIPPSLRLFMVFASR